MIRKACKYFMIIVTVCFFLLPVTFSDIYAKVWTPSKEFILEVFKANGITYEWTQKADTSPEMIVLQIHGGAYIFNLERVNSKFRKSAAEYAKRLNAGVLTIDYRIAPVHPFPAALLDVVDSYLWLLEKGYEPSNIIITGTSSAGGLALSVAMYLRDHDIPLPAAIVTMSAWTNLKQLWLSYPYVGDHDYKNPYISPFYGDFKGLPPILMQYSFYELVEEDTTVLAENAKAQGVSIVITGYYGYRHVFQLNAPDKKVSKLAWDEVEKFVKSIIQPQK